MTTKIMQRLAGKVSVVIMVALLIAAVGTYGLSNSKHDSTGRATAAVSPSKVEIAPAAATTQAAQQAAVSVVKDVSVSTRTIATPSAPVQSASANAPAPATVTAAAAPPTVTPAPPEVVKAQMAPLASAKATYAKLPLAFIPNQGQFDKGVEYEARGLGYATSLTADAAYFGLHTPGVKDQPGKQALVRLSFAGANKLRFEPSEKQSAFANYIGGPASQWRSHVPTYGRVTSADVYPGIDATFYGNQSNLQFDFMVKPGADPKAIQLKFDGGQVKLDANGDLAIATELGTIHQRKPVLYQEANGVRQPVDGSYKVDGNAVSFEVGAYDSSRTLTIDPVVYFSLVVGGGLAGPPAVGDSSLTAVAEDAGAVYVTGYSNANTLQLSGGTSTIDGASPAASFNHVVVISFSRNGTPIWYTFIGGNDNDMGLGIAVEDPTLNAQTVATPPACGVSAYPNGQCGIYVVGQTFSNAGTFAQNATATDAYTGSGDGFIIRLNGEGFQTAGPVLFGGVNGATSATSVAVRCAALGGNPGCANHDRQNDVYIGMTASAPITVPAGLQLQGGGFTSGEQAGVIVDLRATDLAAPGTNKGTIVYITGTQSASVTALALLPYPISSTGVLTQPSQLVFVGTIASPGGLSYVNPVQACAGAPNCYGGGASDGIWGVFNTEITPNDPTVALSNAFNIDYLGGQGNDVLNAVAALPDGNFVVVGETSGANDFPYTTQNVLTSNNPPVQNFSCGNPSTGNSAACSGTDVIAAVINRGGVGAMATATVGAVPTATATLGTVAVANLTYGTAATVAPAAAGVTATSTVTAGTPATATINDGVQGTLTLTAGVPATAVASTGLISGDLASYEVTGVSVTNLATQSGYWTAPTITFTPNAPATCGPGNTPIDGLPESLPTAHAVLDGNGHITGIVIDSGGVCALNILGSISVTISKPGVQSLTVNAAGSGYQSTAAPNTPSTLPVTFTGATCTTAPTATVTLTNGAPVATVYTGNTTAAGGTNASLASVTLSQGAGCSTQPTGATVPPPGLQSVVITAGTGFQGGSTVMATFTGGTCTSTPTAQFTVQGAGADTTLLLDNALTNSGSCSVEPTGVTFTAPGLAGVSILTGGTGYCTGAPCATTSHSYLVTFNGTCVTPPAATVTVNNVSGNVIGETLVNSGTNCTVMPTTQTIDSGGITNDQVLTGGSGYPANTSFPVTIAAPTGLSGTGTSAGDSTSGLTPSAHCSATATAEAFTNGSGVITNILITDTGCGYPTGVNPAVTVPGPGVTVNITNPGAGYTASAPPTATIPAGMTCTTFPVLGTPTISAVNGATGGQITGIPLTNAGTCTGTGSAGAITFSTTPGVVSVNPGNTGNSYNAAPTVTVPACTTQPSITATLLGAAPTGVGGYTINSYGAGCGTPPGVTSLAFTTPGLLAPPTAGQILTPAVAIPTPTFTVTNPGSSYSSAPAVSIAGCAVTPVATACVAGSPACAPLIPPAAAGTVASISLNSATSGGNGCVNPQVSLTGGNAPGFLSLDALGGSGVDDGNGVSTDANSYIYIAGTTTSPNFPICSNATEVNGVCAGSDLTGAPSYGFVSRISEGAGTIQGINGGGYSAEFGGSNGSNTFNGIVAGQLLNVFVTGQTHASNFPVTVGNAFSGDSDGTLTNLLFNNMTVAPLSASFTAAYAGTASPANVPVTVNFANFTEPFSVAGGSVGGAPGSVVTYSSNSGATTWLTINTSPGGFTVSVNPGTLPPDNYSASFLISSPASDTPPITFVVHMTVTATFETYNCTNAPTTPCAPTSSFAFTYTKVEANASTVTPAQQMLVGLVGLPLTPTPVYPAPGTFTATVNYNTNGAMVSLPGNTSSPATNNNFQWFTLPGVTCNGATPAVCSGTLPLGQDIALNVVPSALDTLLESGAGGMNMAQGSITFTQTNPGGGGITSITITVGATVTPRVILDPTNPGTITYAFSCTGGTPTQTFCTSINPMITNHIQLRGKDDVVNITASGNHAGKIAILTITSTPPGGNASCFTADVPAGSYQAASSNDVTSSALSLPVAVNLAENGLAPCVEGVYQGTLTVSGAAANLGAGDSILTNGTNLTTLGPNDSPVALAPVTVPVTITLGNELYLTSTSSFNYGNYVINSAQGYAPGVIPGANPDNPTGSTLSVLPANQTGTVALTLPPSGYSTSYAVTCNVFSNIVYTPSPGGATNTNSSSVTCDWLTAAISSSSLSAGSPTATLTVGLTSSGTNNVTSLPTNGATPVTYTGSIILTYESGTLAGSSIAYPVTINIARQPLNWTTSATAAGSAAPPPTVNVVTTVGAGNVGYVNGATTPTTLSQIPCGSLYSVLPEYASSPVGALVSNPQSLKINLLAVGNQTFSQTGPVLAAAPAAGWVTVTQSGLAGAGAGNGDGLTCSINLLNLAPGTYTACIDGVANNNPGPTPTGGDVAPVASTGNAACSAAWPLFPAPGVSGAPPANSIGRSVEALVLTLNAAPTLTSNPSGVTFGFEAGSTAPASQNVTLCDGTSLTTAGVCSGGSASIQNITATASVNSNPYTTATGLSWLSLTGGAVGTLAANGTATLTLSVAAAALTGPSALGTGTYSGLITLACANCTLAPASIPVTLTVAAAPVINTVPGTLDQFVFQIGGNNPAAENLSVILSNLPVPSGTPNCSASPATVTGCYSVVASSAANWLSVVGLGGTTLNGTLTTTSLGFQVNANPAPGGTPLAPSNIPYTGTVTITVPSAINNPVVLNVSFLVNPQPGLSVTPPAGFTYTVGGSQPASQTLTFAATNPSGPTSGAILSAGFTASLGGCTGPASGPADPFSLMLSAGQPMASVSSIAGNIGVTQTQVTLAASVGAITSAMAGTYSCTLTVNSPGTSGGPPATNATQTFPVTLTVSTQPIITVGACSASTFNYTLTTAAPTPATITCPVTDSDNSIAISSLAIASGCPASWLTCTVSPASIGGGGPTTATLTLTPSNLANQNPGTFGPTNIILSGTIPGGNAIANAPGVAVTQINTPLITLTPSTALVFGGATGYTQGNLATPGNQSVTGTLAEGTGGTPAGPGTPGTGTLTSIVAASSFAAGACSNGVTAPPNWLAVTQSATGSGSAAVYTFTVAVNPAVFPTLTTSTTCTGTININSTGVTPAAAQMTIPVSFTINPAPGFVVSENGVNIAPGGNFPVTYTIVDGYPVNLTSTAASVPVSVSSAPTQGQAYTVTIQNVTGGNWLTTTAGSGVTAAPPASGFALGVNPSANTLAPGMYNATVTVAPSNSSQPVNTPPVTFTVTLVVDNTATLTAAQSGSLGGPYFPFFTAPGTLTLAVATASSSSGAPATPAQFTVTQTALNGSTPSNLLIINGTQPFTSPASVTLTFSASVANTLGTTAPGTYGGIVTVQVTQTGVTTSPQAVQIPWSITIDAEAAIQTTPTAAQGVTISCVLGLTCNSTIGVAATSTGQNVNIPVTASVTSLPTPWLSIVSGPTTANGASISVAANTIGLQANTSYAGQVVVTSADASNSPYTVPVTLNVLSTACTFTVTGGNISLSSAGTSTGGVLPEVPGTIAFSTTGTCGTYAVTSNVPWLTATGGAGVTYIAMSNPHSTSETGTLTITNSGGGSATVTVTLAANTAPESPNRQITALYQTILGRDPDAGGYNYWLTSGLPLGNMADDFLTGPEAFNSDFAVMAAYQAATGAPPTYAQFTAAVGGVRTGGTAAVGTLFSSLIANDSPAFTATNLYQNLLGRAPTAAESTNCSNLTSCFETIIGFPSSVSPAVTASNEFQSTCGTSACTGVGGATHAATGDHTNVLYVTMLYYVILDRNPDAGGLQFWLGVANGGGPGILFQGSAGYPTRIQILGPGTQGQGFIGSTEFVDDYM